jgi:hypothetical protein
MRSRVKKLRHGIYPWGGAMIRFRLPKNPIARDGLSSFGKRFDEHGPLYLEGGTYAELVGTWDKKLAPFAKGYTLQHLREDFRPTLPFNILALLMWSGIAKDPASFVNDLRPMIYTYWS